MSKKKSHKTPKKAPTPKKVVARKRPILLIAIKFFAICLVVAIGLYISDSKGIFDPKDKNNHTLKKWNAFYDFTESHNVDILLVGNSHLYTGINPKNLSARLGANAFILASPGTYIGDTYFALKEALERTNPTHVVVETYGIDEFNPYTLKDGALSDQFKSFSARKNFWVKLMSTPKLFASKNYGYAWSNTLRNHDYLLTNYEQIEKNTDPRSRFSEKREDELYLGRFVRFTKGITDSVLNIYKEKGARVQGEDYTWNEYTEKYVNQIVELCEEKGVELIFLTLPMYKEHIENYSSWKKELEKLIAKSNKPWLNLQTSEYHDMFGTESFESTYNSNQHMTYNGSMLATYELADFIEKKSGESLPNRSKNKEWKDLFYGEEGFFEHYSPNEGDKKHQIIAKNIRLENVKVQEIDFVTNKKNKSLIAKIDKLELLEGTELDSCKLVLNLKMEMKGAVQNATIPLVYDRFHTNPDYYIFKRNLIPVSILQFNGGKMVCD
ncbi:MAG: hypothetical protein COA32_02265 [Fluviicola sp.]|nr:MAG: hypothetical protein COA32_02265 [Fluviicola sp.]